MKYNWKLTKCRAKYKGTKSANYTFYIVDYDIPDDYEKYPHILEMRNKGLVKTKYFYNAEEAVEFLFKYIWFQPCILNLACP